MIDEIMLSRRRHIGAKFGTHDGSLELWLNIAKDQENLLQA